MFIDLQKGASGWETVEAKVQDGPMDKGTDKVKTEVYLFSFILSF